MSWQCLAAVTAPLEMRQGTDMYVHVHQYTSYPWGCQLVSDVSTHEWRQQGGGRQHEHAMA